ncbi:MAG TPA: PQQ-binding-like beta-propeller repeat protein [Gemmataceae bacterium]|nr:PQQ-binding-like beta-propeller repeat protein [Gemmataceae bacterium]
MRCPNGACRQVFTVQDTDEANSNGGNHTELLTEAVPGPEQPTTSPPDEVKDSQRKPAGSVGEFVTVLEAEVVQEMPPSAARPPSTKSMPPKKDAAPILPADVVDEHNPDRAADGAGWSEVGSPSNATTAPRATSPTDRPTGEARSWHEPPPVRRRRGEPLPDGADAPDAGAQVNVFESDTPSTGTLDEAAPAPPAKTARLSLVAVVILVGLLGLGVTMVAIFAFQKLGKNENEQFAAAQRDYGDANYASAGAAFDNLIKNFPKSAHLPRYHLYAELSQIRDQVSTQLDPVASLERLNQLVKDNRDNPQFKDFHNDVGLTYRSLVATFSEEARKSLDAATLARARAAFAESQKFKLKDGLVDDENRLRDAMDEVQKAIAQAERRRKTLDQIGRLLAENHPTIDTVARARDIAEQEGLKDDAEAKSLISKLEEAVRLWVRYVSKRTAPTPLAVEPVEASLLIAPLTTSFTNPPKENGRIVPALARGVLYGMDQGTGEARWLTRVGIDTTALPIRLPASPTSPELFLVLSAARNTVMTLEAATGRLRWQHKLSAPCLGRPVVKGPWAYVPTYDGRVYEIETVQGYLQGYFDLGQPLSVGGVAQEGTDLVFFPGDSDNIYVLDTALSKPPREKKCVMILHTGHPSGSLRGEPIIVTRTDPRAPGNPEAQASWPPYLILSQADGLNHMKLRVFSLPIESPDAQPILQPEPRVSGWSWFQPYHDGEKLAFVTDLGVLGLFGINQVRNEDQPIFPALTEEQKPAETALGRAQVVWAVENDFWVLANGELQRLHFDLFAQKMLPMWPAPLPLGSPVHAGQLDDNGKILFIVTQDPKRQGHLASAVDIERGKIVWQRQLGLDGQGDPLVVAGHVVVSDRGGGVFAFGTKRERLEPGQDAWWKPEALPPGEAAVGTPYLFAADNGATIYQVSSPDKGTQLSVRKYRFGADGEPKLVKEQDFKFDLPAPLAGAPALSAHGFLLALSDGTMQRIPVPLAAGPGIVGPTWNSPRADEGARAYIVPISADDFLITDGSRGLIHWRWPANKTFSTVPEARVPTVELPARIVAAPVVLPQAKPGEDLRVVVADADNNLTLVGGPELQNIERTWPVGGEITAGPFLRGQRIGCVVNRQRLVWIDPGRDHELWHYTMTGEAIVGEPQIIEDALVVANLSGRFLALNPQTGQPRGSAYTLKARAAPVATPVAYGKDEAFVPLTDGTVFILPLRRLREPPALPRFMP